MYAARKAALCYSVGVSNLLSCDELRGLLHDPDLRIIDARHDLVDPEAGRSAWTEAHLPGAVHLDLTTDLSGPVLEHGGRHPLPTVDAMAALFGRSGIGPGTRVVVYDRDTGMFAARVWWMLRYLGHDDVQVLDGGIAAWQALGLPLEQSSTAPEPRAFVPRPRPEMLATRADVLSSLGDETVLLLDARSGERFRGEVASFDPLPGHIPGAVNHFYADNLSHGRLRPAAELRELYRDVASAPAAIAYCGSGVSAALDLLAIDEAGIRLPRLYVGSWSDWSAHEGAPVETGPSGG